MWSLGYALRRRAVLRALSAVGDPGMSLPALGVALDLSETSLSEVLHGMVRNGEVADARNERRGMTVCAPRYRLATPRPVTPVMSMPRS